MSNALVPPTSNQRRGDPGVAVTGELLEKNAALGNNPYEGAEKLGRELGSWQTRIQSADGENNGNKETLDARGLDLMRNHGNLVGARSTHQDSIVGAQYRLNAEPKWRTLGLSDEWADEFSEEVEEKFYLSVESDEHYADTAGRNTLTDHIRLGIGCFFTGGEVVATMDWLRGSSRPFQTAMNMIDANRLCNPNMMPDSKLLRRGVALDRNGAPAGFWFRKGFVRDAFDMNEAFSWEYWPIRKRWGRLQVLHILEQNRPGQNRGIAQLVSVLKETRMGKRYHELALENAIVQASYAAAIESELPPEAAFEMIGAVEGKRPEMAMGYLAAVAEYHRGGRNLEINGVKIPHLFPGSKLNMLSPERPEGVGTAFEDSLNRYISTGLGISYEELTHNYSNTNYSSARAAMNATQKAMRSKKRMVADKMANSFYQCWLEEMISEDKLESTKALTRKNKEWFYEPFMKQAVSNASWIGASIGQVDEMKETQAAVLRVKNGLSTYEAESARLGRDWRDTFNQRAKEEKLIGKLGLVFNLDVTKEGTNSAERGASENQKKKDEEEDDGLND